MLRAHSLLWHYLWVAPNLLLLLLAYLIWRRKMERPVSTFFIFAVIIPIAQLTVYAADILPSVSPENWWRVFWAGLLVEALVKFALIGEIFSVVFDSYSSLAKLGKFLIRGVGIALVLSAVAAAAYTPKDSTYGILAGAHLLEQTIYMIECGLIVFLFIFASYFHLRWSRPAFGIMLGLGISACVHLAIWALAANGNLSSRYRVFLDFPIMATYHLCVLIWYYFLLVPEKKFSSISKREDPSRLVPELEVWNQELERLIHQ